MNHLMRELAPVTDDSWSQIDQEASRSLKHFLAARRLVDFTGPLGWEFSAVDVGRVDTSRQRRPGRGGGGRAQGHAPGRAALPFSLSQSELAAADRGATDLDLDPVIAAGRAAALAEDHLVFHGYAAGRRRRHRPVDAARPVTISDDYSRYPEHVAKAVATLRAADVGRPVRHRPRGPLLHRRHRDHRARRLPGLRAPPPDPRRVRWCGRRPWTAQWCSANAAATSS